MAASQQNSERWWDAELERLRGELLWAQSADAGQIQATFQRAIDIAQAQQAKSLELRAAMSLARWWQAHSRAAEAKQLLTSLYGWFTEGFDTSDLQTAQAIIASL
jgi:predicted ATPase